MACHKGVLCAVSMPDIGFRPMVRYRAARQTLGAGMSAATPCMLEHLLVTQL